MVSKPSWELAPSLGCAQELSGAVQFTFQTGSVDPSLREGTLAHAPAPGELQAAVTGLGLLETTFLSYSMEQSRKYRRQEQFYKKIANHWFLFACAGS